MYSLYYIVKMSSFSKSRLTNHLFVFLLKLLLILQKVEGQLGDVTSILIRKLTNDYDQVCSKSCYSLARNIVEAPKKIRPKFPLKKSSLQRIPASIDGGDSQVFLGIDIFFVDQMDPQTSSYDATFVFEFTWTDDRLSWSEFQYPIGFVFLHASDIWFPDLGVFQMIGDADSSLPVANKRAKVHSNGLVSITFSSMVSSICGVSGLSYPRDGHYCHLTLEYQKQWFIQINTILTAVSWQR